MSEKRLVLKSAELLQKSCQPNPYRLALKSGVSHTSVINYMQDPENIKRIDLSILYLILSRGLDLSDSDILDMRVGDLFEIK